MCPFFGWQYSFSIKFCPNLKPLNCHPAEFLPLFNHYILKGLEHGVYKRIYQRIHADLYTNEQFDMAEPLPLGYDNVVFAFMCLAMGVWEAIQ